MTLLDWLIGLVRPRRPPARPPAPPVPVPPPVPPPPDTPVPLLLLDAHNEVRAARGLPPLRPDTRLQAAAQSHCDAMARSGVESHTAAGDGPFLVRTEAAGLGNAFAAENLGAGYPTVSAAMVGWMNSPKHRDTILDHYSLFGGAVTVDAHGVSWWTTVFASPTGGAS